MSALGALLVDPWLPGLHDDGRADHVFPIGAELTWIDEVFDVMGCADLENDLVDPTSLGEDGGLAHPSLVTRVAHGGS